MVGMVRGAASGTPGGCLGFWANDEAAGMGAAGGSRPQRGVRHWALGSLRNDSSGNVGAGQDEKQKMTKMTNGPQRGEV